MGEKEIKNPLSDFIQVLKKYVPSLLEKSKASLKLLKLVFHKFTGTCTLKYPKIGYPTRVYSWFEYLMPSLMSTGTKYTMKWKLNSIASFQDLSYLGKKKQLYIQFNS